MSRRKKKTSLFEVFGGGMDAPEWMKKGNARAEATRPAPMQLKRPPEIDRPVGAGREADAQGEADARQPAPSRGRLTVSLGYAGLMAIVLGLLIALLLAYKLGQMSRQPLASGADQAGVDITAPRDRGDYDFQAVQAMAIAALPSDDLLIIERDIASEADARAIQEYLWRAGYTVLVNVEKNVNANLIAVIDTVKVSSMSPEDLKRYRESLALLGKSPEWKLSNKYDFSDTVVLDR